MPRQAGDTGWRLRCSRSLLGVLCSRREHSTRESRRRLVRFRAWPYSDARSLQESLPILLPTGTTFPTPPRISSQR